MAPADDDEPTTIDSGAGSAPVLPPGQIGQSVPPADPAPSVEPVRRRRSSRAASAPSLQPPLLSGRSLAPPRKPSRFAVLADNKGIVVAVVAVLVVIVAVLGGKALAGRAADAAMDQRSEELSSLLDGATPRDFLAFGASVKTDGSLAQRVRDTDGFVNVKARADLAFIRFQPSGWWSGFTERCLVASVRADGTTIEAPKTACVRVPEPSR